MSLRDVLLYIDTYPEPTPTAAISQAVAFCSTMESTLSALCIQIDVRVPGDWLTDKLLGLSKIAQGEEQQSQDAGQAARTSFEQQARDAGVLGQVLTKTAQIHCAAESVVSAARTRDLCLVPYVKPLGAQRLVAEGLIFDSGRPALIFQPGTIDLKASLQTVVIAWDGSGRAARAIADARPILKKAEQVRVMTAIHEKPDAIPGLAADLIRNLKAHGIDAVPDEIDIGRRRIGQVLDQYVQDHSADLLVMGAFGHSRLREFILGGATEHVLDHLPAPLLLSN